MTVFGVLKNRRDGHCEQDSCDWASEQDSQLPSTILDQDVPWWPASLRPRAPPPAHAACRQRQGHWEIPQHVTRWQHQDERPCPWTAQLDSLSAFVAEGEKKCLRTRCRMENNVDSNASAEECVHFVFYYWLVGLRRTWLSHDWRYAILCMIEAQQYSRDTRSYSNTEWWIAGFYSSNIESWDSRALLLYGIYPKH